MTTFSYSFYRAILAPALRGLLQLGVFMGGKKWREFLHDKNQQLFHFTNTWTETEIAKKHPLWIHAASGEIEYARPLLRELKKNYPDIPLLVTFTSPSAKLFLTNLPDVAAWGPAPWEKETDCQKFLDRFQPRLAFFARTDLWPILAHTLKDRELPAVLFSATFANDSTRLKWPLQSLTAKTLECLDQVQVVSPQDLAKISELHIKTPVEITGDTRYDQVFFRLAHPKNLPFQIQKNEQKILIAGSTWPEDEAVLLKALQELPNWRVIFVPHEPAHVFALQKKLLAQFGRETPMSSNQKSWQDRFLIVDQIGILAELYTQGDAAFVGGSYRRRVHSVMEPLAAGLPVIVGPSHLNNREAIEMQQDSINGCPLVQCAVDAKAFQACLQKIATVNPIREKISQHLQQKQGATGSVMKWAAKYIDAEVSH